MEFVQIASICTATTSPIHPAMRQGKWNSLPTEMKLAMVDVLMDDPMAVRTFAKVDKDTHVLCTPASYKNVQLRSYEELVKFLTCVPREHYYHIIQLDVCTASARNPFLNPSSPHPRTDALSSLLNGCPRLQYLSLHLADSLAKTILPTFARLTKLNSLTINNCSREDVSPISERLVVSIAGSIPNLSDLSLSRISRSKMHAPELVGAYPYVALVIGDENIDSHSVFGHELWLPSLLRLRRLRKLVIRDTHLGDSRWTTTPVHCQLEVLELGGYHMASEDYNRACINRILSAVSTTVRELSLGPMVTITDVARPLNNLAKLRLSLYFPLGNIVEALATFARSPIEYVEVQVWEDELVDVCKHLKEFLCTKIKRGARFYQELTQITISVTPTDVYSKAKQAELNERAGARRHLEELCTELKLRCQFLCEQEMVLGAPWASAGNCGTTEWGRALKQ